MKTFLVGVVAVLSLATLANSSPLLDPQEEGVQVEPFSLSPGNVNPDEFFGKLYANGEYSKVVGPGFKLASAPEEVTVEKLGNEPASHENLSETSPNEEEQSGVRIRRSPQHHGGHHNGGGWGHGGGHYGGHHGGWGHGGGHHGGHHGGWGHGGGHHG